MNSLQEMKEMDFSFEWGERASLWLHDFFSYCFIEENDLPWNQINNSIQFVINPDTSGGYIKTKEFQTRAVKHGEFFLDRKKIFWLMKKYDAILERLNTYLQKVETTDFSQMNKEELLLYFKEFVSISNQTCKWYRGTRHETEREAEKIVRKLIAERFPESERDKIFQILTTSPYSDPIKEEKDDWLKILKKGKVIEEDFSNHIRKHSMFFTNIYTEEELKQTIIGRYESDKDQTCKLVWEKIESEKKASQLKEKQKLILEAINSEKLKDYLIIFQRFGEYRFRLKPGYAGIEVLSLKMLSRLGELAGMSVKDLHELLTIKETLNFLKTGDLPNYDILEARKKCRVYVVCNKKQIILQGDEGINFLNETVFRKKRDLKELKGTPACSGFVKGRVKLILSNKMDEIQKALEEFEEGDILVSHNTQPNMVPLMAKAAAIVTAQGGITSHSAVVAREFNIPCVVGIDSVTLHLKDGETIEVDANKGIVRKIK
jgi:phosphohistidine swiveling domain-containing protein